MQLGLFVMIMLIHSFIISECSMLRKGSERAQQSAGEKHSAETRKLELTTSFGSHRFESHK
jgi:hypothetical protein